MRFFATRLSSLPARRRPGPAGLALMLVILALPAPPAGASEKLWTGDDKTPLLLAATPTGMLSTGGTPIMPGPLPIKAHSDWQEEEEAAPSSPADSGKHTAGAVRSGGLEHSERLAALDDRFAPGRVFDPQLIAQDQTEGHWYRIPSWLSGLWQARSETILAQTDLHSGAASTVPFVSRRRQSMAFGMQQDASGNVWHLVKLPIVRRFKLENRVEYKVEVDLRFLDLIANQFLSMVRTIAIQVENDTNLIVETRQEEGLWHISPIAGRQARCLGSVKTFDMHGTPLGVCRVALKLERTKPFAPRASLAGEDLRASLSLHLLRRGLGDLAPAAAK